MLNFLNVRNLHQDGHLVKFQSKEGQIELELSCQISLIEEEFLKLGTFERERL